MEGEGRKCEEEGRKREGEWRKGEGEGEKGEGGRKTGKGSEGKGRTDTYTPRIPSHLIYGGTVGTYGTQNKKNDMEGSLINHLQENLWKYSFPICT